MANYPASLPSSSPADHAAVLAEVIAIATELGTRSSGPAVKDRVPVFIRKSADESVNNRTAMQDDDHLSFSIGASETWLFEFTLVMICSSGSADLDAAITVPASASVMYASLAPRATDTLIQSSTVATTSGAEVGPIGVASTATMGTIRGVVVNSTNAGTVQLQWAQNVLTVADSTVKAGSYLLAHRVA